MIVLVQLWNSCKPPAPPQNSVTLNNFNSRSEIRYNSTEEIEDERLDTIYTCFYTFLSIKFKQKFNFKQNCFYNKVQDSWKNARKGSSEIAQKSIAKKYPNMKLSTIFGVFPDLIIHPIKYLGPLFNMQFFFSFHFGFGHKTNGSQKTW